MFLCFVFDEVDSIYMDKRYDPSDFFYRFLRYRMYIEDDRIKVCLIVITNNALVLDDNLDAGLSLIWGVM